MANEAWLHQYSGVLRPQLEVQNVLLPATPPLQDVAWVNHSDLVIRRRTGRGVASKRIPAEEREQVREREKRLAAIVHHAWNANGTLPWPLLRQHLAAVVRGLRRRSASPRRAEGEIGVAAGVFGAVAPRAGSDVHINSLTTVVR